VAGPAIAGVTVRLTGAWAGAGLAGATVTDAAGRFAF
jgi:hypothetical protein